MCVGIVVTVSISKTETRKKLQGGVVVVGHDSVKFVFEVRTLFGVAKIDVISKREVGESNWGTEWYPYNAMRDTFTPRHRGTERSSACKRAKPKRDETWTQVQAERDLSSRYWHVIRPER